MAGQTKEVAGAVTDATGSSLAGNIAGNVLTGLAGGVVGGSAGAAIASNVTLYNQGHDKNESEAEKEAQELHHEVEAERAKLGQVFVPSEGNGPVQVRGMAGAGTLSQGTQAATNNGPSAPVYNPGGAARGCEQCKLVVWFAVGYG
ncbi:hypothetical protein G3N95_00125 [Paraburkholderia sp. Tr-20389]|uniref:hypothetical protein n=1 Tax=Paraburkholderia sp. Tr-20389 TaxID=2703903 RepID=UPI00197E4265|nr:hypothetical protein [Paraburkholderia sp. Tr-20389]MBN3751329.1 hypothetical protein [Paraburkholderia sp. Tr-20389]